jgi:SAM-dependent methyltransferase
MLGNIRTKAQTIIRKMGFEIVRNSDSVHVFHSNHYLCHNARRLEHLASLRIPVAGMSVLEVGAGIGDHSHYYINRGCKLTITEARPENIDYLRRRYPNCNVQFLNMESPSGVEGSPFDVVHCYGLLYHLSNPKQALNFLSQNTKRMLLLETCVSFGESNEINLTAEVQSNPTQAYSGVGCRPTRAWLFRELQSLFEYVYLPKTQPFHEEFPLDWTNPENHKTDLNRAIFIVSRERLENETLTPSLILQQTRHE